MSDPLRPTSFDTYVGQKPIIERLRIMVGAAKARGEPMPHILLSGPPGLGKTSLANIVATEMGTALHVVLGPNIEKPADIVASLRRLAPGDVLFLDEIHSAPKWALESLYPAMEDFIATVNIDCVTHILPVQVGLHPFTLVGATTQPGLLEGPLRDRFSLPMALAFYDRVELVTILTANAIKLRISFNPDALSLLAARSRGTPRIANHLLRFCRDYALVKGSGTLTVPVTEAALTLQGIDVNGLNEQDRQLLRLLARNAAPLGVDAIAATMGLRADTIGGVIEPFLLREGLILRTARGRKATEAGLAAITP